MLLKVDFDAEIVWGWVGEGEEEDHLKGEVRVDQIPPTYRFPT